MISMGWISVILYLSHLPGPRADFHLSTFLRQNLFMIYQVGGWIYQCSYKITNNWGWMICLTEKQTKKELCVRVIHTILVFYFFLPGLWLGLQRAKTLKKCPPKPFLALESEVYFKISSLHSWPHPHRQTQSRVQYILGRCLNRS